MGERLGLGGAQAQDEVQGLAAGAGRVEAALEGALGSVEEGEERLAELALSSGQGGRSALALGLLQGEALLVNPGVRGRIDGARELARGPTPLDGETDG
jgi:hypothetical protein